MSIGHALKEARTKKSISLDEVHAKIKVHPRILQLLEEDKFDKLPSPIFAKSFLKSYADFLEIDAESLLKGFEKTAQKEPEQKLFIRPAEEAQKHFAGFDTQTLAMILMVVAVLVVGWIGMHLAKSAKSQINKMKPTSVVAAKLPSAAVAKPAPVKKSSDWLRSVDQGNFPEIAKSAPLELQVKALDNVWLRITCDGKVLFQSILKRGASERWKASEKIDIWTGNSSNMFLTLNNYGIGSPGKGVVKKMLITRDGVKLSK